MSDVRQNNFLADIVKADLASNKTGGRVVTRFPPEPNGFLHIGHAKSIILNFGLAQQFSGHTHLRFDDTNPETEETSYVESIQEDVRWLGFEWGKHLYFASGFFEEMYQCALRLIQDGNAYVDSQSIDQLRERRGSYDRPGSNSPFRVRTVGENLELFRRMREGEFPDGAAVLRAKIDMAHPNLLMRDPLLYRIRHAHHHRTGDRWCIYPMYDFAHPLEDAFEGVTHSICTLEFESNRVLYDWVLDHTGPWNPRPHQYEFARLALGYTVMSKRKLLQLVNEKRVSGWDDPRMPTIAGMRRRGITPESLRSFAEMIGVAKNNSAVDIGKLEFAIRQDLESRAPRAMAVLQPLPVVITNWPADRVEDLELAWWPGEPERAGTRKVPFGREVFIEREDFSENPPPGWKRLAPGREVRLMGAYLIRCDELSKSKTGELTELRCSYLPGTKSGAAGAERKVAGTLHWVPAKASPRAEVRLYDRLFAVEQPDAEENFVQHLNPRSLVVMNEARIEPALAQAAPGSRYQFIRQGYFFVDPTESRPGAPVFSQIIGLKDTWAKASEKPEEQRLEKKRKDSKPSVAQTERRGRESAPRILEPAAQASFERYRNQLGISIAEAEMLAKDRHLGTFFDAALGTNQNPKAVAKWLLNELLAVSKGGGLEGLPFDGQVFGRMVALVDGGKITPAAGKRLLAELVARGGEPERLVKELGLEKVDDSLVIGEAVAKVLQSQAAEVARYRAGEKKLLGVLLGAVMRETKGAADASTVRKALTEKLG